MIDALDARALVGCVFLQHGRRLVHLRIKLDRRAERVRRPQRSALMRQVGKRSRQIAAGKPEGGAVEVVFAAELETQSPHIGLARAPQHQRMMIALLDAAQIERVLGLVADQKPEAIGVEGTRPRKIGDAQLDMAGAYDVERRIEDRIADGHGSSRRAPC